MTIRAPRGAQISVDGKPVGFAPLDPPQLCLEPGSHTLSATLTGHVPQQEVVQVLIGMPDVVDLTLQVQQAAPPPAAPPTAEPADEPSIPLMVVGSLLSAGAIVAGIVVLVDSGSAESERDGLADDLGVPSPCSAGTPHDEACADIEQLADDAMTRRGAGITALVLGGLIGGATAAYGFWPRAGGEKTAVVVLPTMGGMLIRGSW